MPRHARRRGSSRLVLPAVLGGVLLAGIGSVAAGTVFAPSPAGAVDAAMAAPDRPPGVAPTDGSGNPAAELDDSPDPAAVQSEPTDSDPVAGASLEAPTEAAARPAPVVELTGYQWPLPNGRITLPFGPSEWGSRVVDGEAFHDGLDVATFCGDRIVAAHAGVVVAAGRRYDTEMGWLGDLGPYLDRLEAKSLWSTLPIVIVIDDGNGYRSLYAHLSKVVVGKGDTVAAGDLIGYEGRTGRASGCHLHYGLFSPQETARFGIDPGVVERMLLPPWEIARVDPLLVLPHRPGLDPAARPGEASPVVGGKPPIE